MRVPGRGTKALMRVQQARISTVGGVAGRICFAYFHATRALLTGINGAPSSPFRYFPRPIIV
jgi:hypothetical protein